MPLTFTLPDFSYFPQNSSFVLLLEYFFMGALHSITKRVVGEDSASIENVGIPEGGEGYQDTQPASLRD